MAYSYQDMVSDGSTTQVQVAINFIDRSHLSVLVNGALTAYTWLSPSVNTIVLGSAPTAGSVIRIKRTTPRDKIKYDYSKGSQFSTATVDANNLQLLYIDQEIQEELTAVYGSVSVANLYLGPSATPPTVTPGGLPVSDGMMYYNTTDARIYVKTPDGWRMLTPTSAIAVANTVATAGQTVFNTPAPFTPGTDTVEVWVNGARINIGTDYTEATNGTSITLAVPATVDDEVTIRVIQTLAVGSTASNLVSHGSSTVKDALDSINLADYAALRAYTGQSKRVFITGYFVTSAPSGIAGDFVRDDSDTTSADNGGTIIVSANGKRWKRQYSYFVSVKWFGAIGDRIADDTQPISNAIATGKSVFFPKGNYLSGTQELSNPGQTLFGEGAASILTPTSKGINLLFPKATYISISDLRLNGIETDATNSVFAICTSSATPATYLTVRNVLFSGFDTTFGFSNAIKFDDNCSYGLVENCTIERLWGNTSGHGYGVLAGNVTGCKVLSNKFIATSGRGRHGIYFSAGCSNSVADDNFISGFDYEGISQYSSGAQPTCARNIYNNNVLLGCAASTNPYSGSIGIYQHSYGCVISNNVITDSGKKSIAVDAGGVTDCLNTVITGNTISYSGSTGIDLTGTKNTVISSNTIQDSSTSSAGSFANIMLRAYGGYNCENTLIEGNIVPASSTARSALSLDPGSGGPTLLKLSGNSFGAGVSYTLELNSVTGVEIDGRLQFRLDSVGYGPIANGASLTGPLVLAGAKQGEVCTVSHTSNHDGCVMYAYCNSDGTGVLTIANLSGASKTIPSGTLRVDVWKRNAPL